MILVTGGCGFIGSHLVKRLMADPYEVVVVIDNYSRGINKIKGVTYVEADIRKSFRVCNLCTEIIHLAFINGTPSFYSDPDLVLDVAVRGMLNVIEACKTYNIRKLTLVSSSEVCRAKLVGADESIPLVIPDPYNPRYSYSAGKVISEMLAIHNAPKLFDRLLIARPFNIYGPGMSQGHVIPDFIARLRQLNGKYFEILGDGSETRSFCYIDDFIDGFMLMRERGEHMGIYNIGTRDEITINDLANTIANRMGKTIRVKSVGQFREGDATRRKPDISKLAALGYKPKISLTKGLKRTMA